MPGPAAHIRFCRITAATFTVEIDDGRTLQAPTVAMPAVFNAPWTERRRFRVVDGGLAVEWPSLGYKVTLRQLMGVE